MLISEIYAEFSNKWKMQFTCENRDRKNGKKCKHGKGSMSHWRRNCTPIAQPLYQGILIKN